MKDDQKNFGLGIDLLAEMTTGPRIDAQYAVSLIGQGAALNVATREGITTLMCAAANAQNGIVKAMLESGRDVGLEARDDHGWTALITAAHRGNAETVKLLLAAGADATAKDLMGRDALAYAKGDAEKEAVLKAALESAGLPAPTIAAQKRKFGFGM